MIERYLILGRYLLLLLAIVFVLPPSSSSSSSSSTTITTTLRRRLTVLDGRNQLVINPTKRIKIKPKNYHQHPNPNQNQNQYYSTIGSFMKTIRATCTKKLLVLQSTKSVPFSSLSFLQERYCRPLLTVVNHNSCRSYSLYKYNKYPVATFIFNSIFLFSHTITTSSSSSSSSSSSNINNNHRNVLRTTSLYKRPNTFTTTRTSCTAATMVSSDSTTPNPTTTTTTTSNPAERSIYDVTAAYNEYSSAAVDVSDPYIRNGWLYGT
jgi:hypothetical protein